MKMNWKEIVAEGVSIIVVKAWNAKAQPTAIVLLIIVHFSSFYCSFWNSTSTDRQSEETIRCVVCLEFKPYHHQVANCNLKSTLIILWWTPIWAQKSVCFYGLCLVNHCLLVVLRIVSAHCYLVNFPWCTFPKSWTEVLFLKKFHKSHGDEYFVNGNHSVNLITDFSKNDNF